jgi:hypothetical protein
MAKDRPYRQVAGNAAGSAATATCRRGCAMIHRRKKPTVGGGSP